MRQAEKYALVWKTFFQGASSIEAGDQHPVDQLKNVNIDAIVLDEPSWYVVAASESPGPETWLRYAQDRKLEDPRYSVAALRRDIRIARRLEGLSRTAMHSPSTEELSPERLRCPWVRPYCIRSGRPVPATACTACDVTCSAANTTQTPQAQEAVP